MAAVGIELRGIHIGIGGSYSVVQRPLSTPFQPPVGVGAEAESRPAANDPIADN